MSRRATHSKTPTTRMRNRCHHWHFFLASPTITWSFAAALAAYSIATSINTLVTSDSRTSAIVYSRGAAGILLPLMLPLSKAHLLQLAVDGRRVVSDVVVWL